MTPSRYSNWPIIALFLGLVLLCTDTQAAMILSPVTGEEVTAGDLSMPIDFYAADQEVPEEVQPASGLQAIVHATADQPGGGGILTPWIAIGRLAFGGFVGLADEVPPEMFFAVESPPS